MENGVTSGFAWFLRFQKYAGILWFNETDITGECVARFARAPQESSRAAMQPYISNIPSFYLRVHSRLHPLFTTSWLPFDYRLRRRSNRVRCTFRLEKTRNMNKTEEGSSIMRTRLMKIIDSSVDRLFKRILDDWTKWKIRARSIDRFRCIFTISKITFK